MPLFLWALFLLAVLIQSQEQASSDEWAKCLEARSVGECGLISPFCYFYIIPQFMPVWAPYKLVVSSTKVVVKKVLYVTVLRNGDEISSYKYMTIGANGSLPTTSLRPLTWETMGTIL
jgi:hypothetical protein